MMKFECKDMGMDCDFVATAETREEVMQMAVAHASDVHAEMMKSLSPEQMAAMPEQLAGIIKEIAA